MQSNVIELQSYLIIIPFDNDSELALRAYLQLCHWSRKYPKQHVSTEMMFGVHNEYVFYNAELTADEVLFLKLKFAGIAYIVTDEPTSKESNRDKFKRATGNVYEF